MRPYELSILFHPDLEMNLDPALEKVKKLLESNGANITKEDNEGKKRLAYQINKQDFAVYRSTSKILQYITTSSSSFRRKPPPRFLRY